MIGIYEYLGTVPTEKVKRLEVIEKGVHAAAQHFVDRTKLKPEVVHIHPATVDGLIPEKETLKIGGLIVRPRYDTLQNHVWVGIENE